MSLVIYDMQDELPKDLLYIENCERFFDGGGAGIPDTEFACKVLKEIEHAERLSRSEVKYPWKEAVYNASCLSTGMKVLMCVLDRPDICFNISECGINVLHVLCHLTQGNVRTRRAWFAYNGARASECDIIYKSKHFTDIYTFLEECERIENDEEEA